MSRWTIQAKRFEIETLETEILELRGREREEAMKAYRKLLILSANEPIYFVRS